MMLDRFFTRPAWVVFGLCVLCLGAQTSLAEDAPSQTDAPPATLQTSLAEPAAPAVEPAPEEVEFDPMASGGFGPPPPAPEEETADPSLPGSESNPPPDAPVLNADLSRWTDRFAISGFLQSDVRFQVENNRGMVKGDGYEFEMNQNLFNLRTEIFPTDQVKIVVDTRLRYFGFTKYHNLEDLDDRSQIDGFNVELNEAYLDIMTDYVGVKIGRQQLTWGSADTFNQVDYISAHDLSDPLDFTAKVPNQMVNLEFYPADWLTLSTVWVPIFKPSQLPPSSEAGFAIIYDERGCLDTAPYPPITGGTYTDESGVVHEQDPQLLADMFAAIQPCSIHFPKTDVSVADPGISWKSMQGAFRMAFSMPMTTMALTYYVGRWSFPIPVAAYAKAENSRDYPGDLDVEYVAQLRYPRMQMVGYDFSHSMDYLGGLGIRGEFAVIFPERMVFAMEAPGVHYENDMVPSDPFIKAMFGFDYTFTSWLYVNFMYLRGFMDEFNDMYGIHNYLVGNIDLKFFDNELLLRISDVWSIDEAVKEGVYGAVFTPSLTWVVMPSVELVAGALIVHGPTKPYSETDYAKRSKFGQRATGRNIAYLRAKVSF